MKLFEHLIRPDLQDFAPYSSARKEAKIGRVWLNANESPFASHLNRYPEPQPPDLIEKLAKLYQVSPSQLLLTRGSDEGIDLLIRLFCRAGMDEIVICPPTFGMYAVCAKLQGAAINEIPLEKTNHFQLNKNFLTYCKTNTKLIFLCSPNNPTGNLLAEKDILSMCEALQKNSIIVVDEAYIEFSNSNSLSSQLPHYSNLVILRTLSKAYGLAGVRCGAVLAYPELINWLKKIIPPYPIPSITNAAVLETIQPQNLEQITQQIARIKTEKQRMTLALSQCPTIQKVWPSEANFLLLETYDAKACLQSCHREGIVIRDMSQRPQLENCVRITIGTVEENNQLLNIFYRNSH